MSTSSDEQKALLVQISQVLSDKGYRCSKIQQLDGGSVNFVFRGTLGAPFADTSQRSLIDSVLIKHSAGFLSCNKHFALDVSRWNYEVYMLQALEKFQASKSTDVVVIRTPKLLRSDPGTYTQIIEYISDAVDLKQILVSPSSTTLSPTLASSCGHALGRWLRDFHDWTSHPDQIALQQYVQHNRAMSELKYRVEFDLIFKVLNNFPDILAQHRGILVDVMITVNEELKSEHGHDQDWGVIHGDFWAGNVLVSQPLHEVTQAAELTIIDWEYAQHGHRAFDLGQMVADLLERHHFAHSELALVTMQRFIQGYRTMSEDLAFRTAIHVGAHMIGWYTRRNPNAPLPAPLDVASEFMQQAVLMIVKAWERDRKWFLASRLACLLEVTL